MARIKEFFFIISLTAINVSMGNIDNEQYPNISIVVDVTMHCKMNNCH